MTFERKKKKKVMVSKLGKQTIVKIKCAPGLKCHCNQGAK